jgi:hypothetical protein
LRRRNKKNEATEAETRTAKVAVKCDTYKLVDENIMLTEFSSSSNAYNAKDVAKAIAAAWQAHSLFAVEIIFRT